MVRKIESLIRDDSSQDYDHPDTLRTYGIGAQILVDLGVRKMNLLSAPKKFHALAGFGLEVVNYYSE
jgi:3,4-dihydroxy 2-butanone 4-phosphate synthase/GTP cyclohydrolase II